MPFPRLLHPEQSDDDQANTDGQFHKASGVMEQIEFSATTATQGGRSPGEQSPAHPEPDQSQHRGAGAVSHAPHGPDAHGAMPGQSHASRDEGGEVIRAGYGV